MVVPPGQGRAAIKSTLTLIFLDFPGEPTLSRGTGGTAFVGGFFDYSTEGPAYQAYQAYISDNPEANAAYFTWVQGSALTNWISANQGGVSIYGHSYGGDTAAAAVADANFRLMHS